jgi:hypothetical protein
VSIGFPDHNWAKQNQRIVLKQETGPNMFGHPFASFDPGVECANFSVLGHFCQDRNDLTSPVFAAEEIESHKWRDPGRMADAELSYVTDEPFRLMPDVPR